MMLYSMGGGGGGGGRGVNGSECMAIHRHPSIGVSPSLQVLAYDDVESVLSGQSRVILPPHASERITVLL